MPGIYIFFSPFQDKVIWACRDTGEGTSGEEEIEAVGVRGTFRDLEKQERTGLGWQGGEHLFF